MTQAGHEAQDLSCRGLVDLVTDYLEGALADDARARFEEHLFQCPGCVEHLDQIKLTLRAVGRLDEDTISAEARDQLLVQFRDWNRG